MQESPQKRGVQGRALKLWNPHRAACGCPSQPRGSHGLSPGTVNFSSSVSGLCADSKSQILKEQQHHKSAGRGMSWEAGVPLLDLLRPFSFFLPELPRGIEQGLVGGWGVQAYGEEGDPGGQALPGDTEGLGVTPATTAAVCLLGSTKGLLAQRSWA